MDEPARIIKYEEFAMVDIRVGEVIAAERNLQAKKPAYVLRVDFGPEIGIKTSSAQIAANYVENELLGRQVLAVVNFPPRLVAGIKSEVLVLAAVCGDQGNVLVAPVAHVKNGSRIL